MPARLIIRNASGPARSVYLGDEEDHTLGRDPDCEVEIAHASVSRAHARVHVNGPDWQIEDLGSKNGTFVNGEKLSGTRKLQPGSVIQLGDVYCSMSRPDRHTESIADQRIDSSVRWRRRLSPSLGTGGLVRESVQAILQLSGFHRGFALLNAGAGQWRVYCRSGIESGELDSKEFSGSLGSVRECVRTGQPVVCHHLDPATWLGGRPSVIEGGIQALLCLPLAVGDRLLGVIYADRTEPGESISELDLNILESLASHAALALAVSRMEEAMQSLAGDLDEQVVWSAGREATEDGTLLITP
ncbi:MAG: FHA domain-containing protein [Xanthomonadales bacterium]|nr:FHA domain-containing protein [Xanthomonadales bacterium]